MTTRHLVDPDFLPFVDMFPPMRLDRDNLDQVRQRMAAMMPSTTPLTEPELRFAVAQEGGSAVPYYFYPAADTVRDHPVVIHLHGGGMVFGAAASSKSGLPPLLRAIGAAGVSIEYRLAPGTRFPGPQEDCYAVLAAIVNDAEVLGIDRNRIVLLGESAGGGLAVSLALMARDRRLHALAGQVLIYPMLDHRTGGDRDVHRNPMTGEFIWTRQDNQFGWESLRGDYAVDDERRGWFSPALADDLSGLPPTYMAVGSLDLFADEDIDFARRLIAAGVSVDVEVFAGAPHGFDLVPDAAAAVRVKASILRAIRNFV